MTQEDIFDLSPDENFNSFNPPADFNPNDQDLDAPLESGVIRTDPREFPTMEALARTSEELAAQPARVRIATLLDNMKPSRRLLISVMARCEDPASNCEIIRYISEFQINEKSVFSPDTILHHLHRSGALERLTEDGSPYDDLDFEPETVIVDGVTYLEPKTPPEIFWHTTDEGSEIVKGDCPAKRLEALFENEIPYHHIYRIILEHAKSSTGALEKTLAPLVNNDPALQKPRMYAPRFIERLAENNAVIWHNGAWRITELGEKALSKLSETTD